MERKKETKELKEIIKQKNTVNEIQERGKQRNTDRNEINKERQKLRIKE